jgi:hypothetical protein
MTRDTSAQLSMGAISRSGRSLRAGSSLARARASLGEPAGTDASAHEGHEPAPDHAVESASRRKTDRLGRRAGGCLAGPGAERRPKHECVHLGFRACAD